MTTRTLILMRHGKAEQPGGGRSDADRPLASRGRADAAAAGAWLVESGFIPQLVLCSPARRTLQTWQAVGDALAVSPPAAFPAELYSLGAPALIKLLAGVPDEIGTLLVVGHNPTISIASMLLGSRGGIDGMRTCGLAVHQADLPWAVWGAGVAPLVAATTARAGSGDRGDRAGHGDDGDHVGRGGEPREESV